MQSHICHLKKKSEAFSSVFCSVDLRQGVQSSVISGWATSHLQYLVFCNTDGSKKSSWEPRGSSPARISVCIYTNPNLLCWLCPPTAQIFYLRSHFLSSLIKTQGPSYSPCGCCCLFFLLTVNSIYWVISATNPKGLSKTTMVIIFIQQVKKLSNRQITCPMPSGHSSDVHSKEGAAEAPASQLSCSVLTQTGGEGVV